MDHLLQQIEVERSGNIFCVRLRNREMSEEDLHQFSHEVIRLIQTDGCRKMVLHLGPEAPLCLYSIFLAKLVSLQRRLRQLGGALKLAGVSRDTYKIFAACNLQNLFDFCADQVAAIAELTDKDS